MRLPNLVVAADWSKNPEKRWMACAELGEDGRYTVCAPEPVGEVDTLVSRLREALPQGGTGLVGFDFPIGLPRRYAERAGLGDWRQALRTLGGPGWERFYEITDEPDLRQPFYPPPKKAGEKGNYRFRLAHALGARQFEDLLRRCDLRTTTRERAECMFFRCGGKQVGAGICVGWSRVLAPSADRVRFWPFDGDLPALLSTPGVVVAEIYPREAYAHLGLPIGGRWSKTRREDRRGAVPRLQNAVSALGASFTRSAQWRTEWGFVSDDDFDAAVGLLSMLQVVLGVRTEGVPRTDEDVRRIEGWILGQQPENTPG